MTDPVSKRIAALENSAAPQIDAPVSTGWRIPILSDGEYSLLLGQANYADNTFTGTWLNSESYDDYPYDSADAQSLRTKLMGAEEVDMSGCCIPGAPGDSYNQYAYGSFVFEPGIEPPILGGGTRPPGYPPDDGYITDPKYTSNPGAEVYSGHVDMVCADNLVVNDHGTNHTGNLRDYGMPDYPSLGVNLEPVNDLLHDHIPIKDAIDAKITADGHLPPGAVVTTVYLGYNGSWCDSGHAGFFIDSVTGVGVDLFDFRATRPHLQLATLSAATETELSPTRLIQLAEVAVGGDWSGGIKFGLKAVAAICEDGVKRISAYDELHEIFLSCRMPPCTPNIFFSNDTSPVLEICVTGYDWKTKVGLWAGHFDLNNPAQIHVNPNATSETVMFSDNPPGLATGQSSEDYTSQFWTGAEIAGNGNGILVTSGMAGRIQEALLFTFADGYSGTGADKAYNHVRLTMKYVAGAQDLILGLHPTSSAGATAYTFSIPGTPTGSTPYPAETHTFDIDVSSFGITVGSFPAIHVTLGNGAGGGFYLFEWSIAFY